MKLLILPNLSYTILFLYKCYFYHCMSDIYDSVCNVENFNLFSKPLQVELSSDGCPVFQVCLFSFGFHLKIQQSKLDFNCTNNWKEYSVNQKNVGHLNLLTIIFLRIYTTPKVKSLLSIRLHHSIIFETIIVLKWSSDMICSNENP